MYADIIDRPETDTGPERIAEFRKLAKLAGLPLSERITEAILQALAAGVTPTGDLPYVLCVKPHASCLLHMQLTQLPDHRNDTHTR